MKDIKGKEQDKGPKNWRYRLLIALQGRKKRFGSRMNEEVRH